MFVFIQSTAEQVFDAMAGPKSVGCGSIPKWIILKRKKMLSFLEKQTATNKIQTIKKYQAVFWNLTEIPQVFKDTFDCIAGEFA